MLSSKQGREANRLDWELTSERGGQQGGPSSGVGQLSLRASSCLCPDSASVDSDRPSFVSALRSHRAWAPSKVLSPLQPLRASSLTSHVSNRNVCLCPSHMGERLWVTWVPCLPKAALVPICKPPLFLSLLYLSLLSPICSLSPILHLHVHLDLYWFWSPGEARAQP